MTRCTARRSRLPAAAASPRSTASAGSRPKRTRPLTRPPRAHTDREGFVEREVLEFDVQFVGAGPAGLAGAIHLADLVAKHNANAASTGTAPIPELNIAVLEKSAEVG